MRSRTGWLAGRRVSSPGFTRWRSGPRPRRIVAIRFGSRDRQHRERAGAETNPTYLAPVATLGRAALVVTRSRADAAEPQNAPLFTVRAALKRALAIRR